VYRKELSKTLRNALNLAIISVALVGCLEQKGSDSAFVNQADPTGAAPSGGAPTGNSSPTISGVPITAVEFGNAYSFTPNASDPDGDALSFSVRNQPAWAEFDLETGELFGQPAQEDVGTYASIEITVSDGTATATLPRFAISVDQVGTVSTTLSWTPPTENEDGTPLLDLAGYKIYWGTTRGQYTHSVKIDNPGISSYVVENLSPGIYDFAGTSFNQDGTESDYSDPVTKVLN
jgi:hypothetical protein